MMIRERSKSKLSTAKSKQKMKQAIREAMGKTPSKLSKNQKNQYKNIRSFSMKTLNPYNRYTPQTDTANLNNSNIVKRNSSQKILSSAPHKQLSESASNRQKNIINSSVKSQVPLLNSYQWWHQNGYDVSSQKKIKQVNSIKQITTYFAYTDKFLGQKKLIVTIQNDSLILEDPLLHVFFINTKKRMIQKFNENYQKIQLNDKNITQVLIVKEKYFDENIYDANIKPRLISQSSEQSSFKYNPKTERILLSEIQKHKDNFFDGVMKQQISNQNPLNQFYLCLHLRTTQTQINMQNMLKSKMANQSIYKQLNFQTPQQNIKKATQKGVKTIFSEGANIKSLSQMASFKLKR